MWNLTYYSPAFNLKRLTGHLNGELGPDETAGLNKLSLSVLADDYKVYVPWCLVAKRPLDPRQKFGGTVVYILVKAGPNLEREQSGRKRVIYIWQSDRPKVDCIKLPEDLQGIFRHECPGLSVVTCPVRKLFILKSKAKSLSRGIENLGTGGQYLRANTITGNYSDSVFAHAAHKP